MNNILNKTIIYLMKLLRNFYMKINTNSKKFKYKYMLPEENAKNIEVYEFQLLEALENKKVKNIAVTSDYGAGKSSFLKTFEKKYIEYSFLDISLATFDEKITDISIIEKSILEQIFYKESYNRIPQSRFKRIKAYKNIYLKAFIGLLSILSLVFLIKPDFLIKLSFYEKILDYSNYLEYLSIGIILVGIFFSIKYFFKNFNGLMLNKFNLQNIEIESKKDDEASLLNKYLDEILYFFEKTNYDIVVFQDLDRFKNLNVFIKLRELNNFINKSKQINKDIVFVYALKDEMFKNQNERVKFFDVIIPIIPYINSKTSYDILLKWFNEIDKSFLRDISIYIQDMRLLKNIFNEYNVFNTQIGNGLDKTKLLSMIIYKNFYPNDYSKLHQGKSIINEIIKKKFKYLSQIEENYLKEIELKQNKIKEYKKDLANNLEVQELRRIYLFEIIKTLNLTNQYFYYDGQRINITNALQDNIFEQIKKSNNLKSDNYSSAMTTFEKIENSINSELSYQDREDLILTKTNKQINKLENEIEDIDKEIETLNTLKLKDILQKLDIEEFKNKEDDYELLQYLLNSGYIDEDYYLYISYDMKNAFSSNDIEFLKSVKNNKSLEYNFELNNIDEIVENLNNNDFYKDTILNVNLVNFLLDDTAKHQDQRRHLFKYLSKDIEEVNKFIAYCIDWIPNKLDFVKLIVKYNTNTWNIIKNYGTKKNLDSYCGWIFHYADIEDIKKLKDFKSYFENKTFMRTFSGKEVDKIIDYIKDMQIQFSNLTEINSHKVLEFIFKNNYYNINEQMLNIIIFHCCAPKSEIENDLKIANLTTIKNKLLMDKKYLISYIENNINEYIKNVFLKIETNTKEDKSIVIELLSNEKLDFELKEKIIKKEEVKINDLEDIENIELFEILFKNNKVIANWNNVYLYYKEHNKIDEVLFDYLNNIENAKELSNTKINTAFTEKNKNFNTKILKDIMENNNFSIEAYKYLLTSNGYWYPSIEISNLEEEKIKILLDYGKFQLTYENLENLKKFNLHIELIIKNFSKFIDEFDKYVELLEGVDNYIKILENKDIEINDKLPFIKKIDYEIINKDLAKIIYWTINQSDENIEKELLTCIIKNLVDIEILVKELKKNNFSCEDINELLEIFKYPYNSLCQKNTKPIYIENNQSNKKLLDILKIEECISTYTLDEKRNKFKINRKRK